MFNTSLNTSKNTPTAQSVLDELVSEHSKVKGNGNDKVNGVYKEAAQAYVHDPEKEERNRHVAQLVFEGHMAEAWALKEGWKEGKP